MVLPRFPDLQGVESFVPDLHLPRTVTFWNSSLETKVAERMIFNLYREPFDTRFYGRAFGNSPAL